MTSSSLPSPQDRARTVQADTVDGLISDWIAVSPDVDVSPMEVTARVLRLSRQLDRHIRRNLRKVGLSGGEFGALEALRRAEGRGVDGGLLPSELRDSLLITSGTVTHRIQRLESRGLVEREPCAEDRRCSYVKLTAAGRDLVDRALEAHVAGLDRLLGHLSAEERNRLAQLLRRLGAGLA